ncbi:VWA domain-containing protein [Glutamicibacter endophyticus]
MLRRLASLGTALALGALALAAVPAAADENLQPVVVVMDYSSSMLEKDADNSGTSRIDAAKKATKHLIDNAPEDAHMGLVAYGSKTPKQCDDIRTLHKPGPVDKKAYAKTIDSLEAVGETPIGASLLHAAKDMEDIKGQKAIILVSDGEENCSKPPACEAAKDLAERGINLTVHTIGFKVNATARKQLECIAQATGGSYVDADNAEDLQEELVGQTLRAFQGYTVAGTPVSGGEQLFEAPDLQPGQYVDTLERGETKSWVSEDGSIKYYKLEAIEPGERLHFAATMIPDQRNVGANLWKNGRVEVQLVNGQGERCASETSNSVDAAEVGRPIAAYTHSPEFKVDQSHGCYSDGSGQLYAKVIRQGELQKDQPMQVELLYVREPAVDPTLLGAETKDRDRPQAVEVTGKATPVTGGSSFNDAKAVDSGAAYADSVLPSEARYYKVHVGNGQKLNVRMTSGNNKDSGTNMASLRVYSSLRGIVDMLGDRSISSSKTDTTITRNMETAVDQSNRDGRVGEDAYLAGDYYVVVYSHTWQDKSNGVPFKYSLALDVTGTEQPFAGAAPVFEAEQAQQSAQASADGQEQRPTDSQGEQGSSEEASTSVQSSDPQALVIDNAGASANRPKWPWFLGGLLIGGGGIAVVGFLFRHRATTRSE